MEPITLGIAAAALLGLLTLKKKNGGPAQLPAGSDAAGFQGFSPDSQQKAWYAACSQAWTASGSVNDGKGNIAPYSRALMQGDKGDALRVANDAWFRGMMDKGYNVIVSDRIVIPEQGASPYLAFVPSGMGATTIPKAWGPMLQLFAQPPGWLSFASAGVPGPQPPSGGLPPFPGQPPFTGLPADPFQEIPDPTVRGKVKELYASDTASLRDLEETAKELDKAGYPQSAAALRSRRDSLKLSRSIDAKNAGGYLYVVRSGDLPINVAQWYGGKKPGVLGQLVKLNPTVAANTWAGWVEGAEVLLPVEWGDPQLKALPPLAIGKPAGSGSGGSGGGSGGGGSGGGSGGGKKTLAVQSKWYYGPNGEGPYHYQSDSEVPDNAGRFGWSDNYGHTYNWRYAGFLPGAGVYDAGATGPGSTLIDTFTNIKAA